MKIIVGLGNIGEKHTTTRHNIGFIILDQLVYEIEKKGVKIKWKEESKLKAITTKIPSNLIDEKNESNEIILLVKPTTFMNKSGEAVQSILNFFKEPLENLIVIFDDIDLPLGKIRVREKGSAGTHNGMKSVIEQVGSYEFKRIRIGIESRGELTPNQQDISSFVLSNFSKNEIPILKNSIDEAIKELKQVLQS